MATINDGGPAFPTAENVSDPRNNGVNYVNGMSLRDYFSGQAMAALIVDPDRHDQSREECARLSYLMADAMIAARSVIA